MRYAQIRSMDISNGLGVGVSLFVQGCHFHCKGCHNPEQWSFEGGKLFTEKEENKILELLSPQYITRFSVLGGEPLEPGTVCGISKLVNKIKKIYPDIVVWVYSGYSFEELYKKAFQEENFINSSWSPTSAFALRELFSNIDVLVDGRFEEEKRDITLKFKGSSNQRVIDVQQTIRNDKIILYDLGEN